jgi:hypothetical protein
MRTPTPAIATFRSLNYHNLSHRRISASVLKSSSLNLELKLKGAGASSDWGDGLLHGQRFSVFDHHAQQRLPSG